MKPESRTILVVDDASADVEFALHALDSLELPLRLVTCRDGVEALDYLQRRGEYATRDPGMPAAVFLDLKMPKVDGFDVLRRMRSDPRLRTVPVVVLTSSRESRDIDTSYELGANAYMVKPMDFEEFLTALRVAGEFWGRLNEPPRVMSGEG